MLPIFRIRIIILAVAIDSEKTVLIVDNQPREAVALQKQLAFAGFTTEIATTGEYAVKILEAHPPDIVLLEASLSDIDSGEVVAFIRSDLRTCRLPVLAMSVFPHMKGRCLKGGCDGLPSKTDQNPRSRGSNQKGSSVAAVIHVSGTEEQACAHPSSKRFVVPIPRFTVDQFFVDSVSKTDG